MNPIRKFKGIYRWLYNEYDPLWGQRLYAQRTLNDKRNTIEFIACDASTNLRISQLWGGQNGWFEFYNTIGGGINTHLYFPDDWFYDYVDVKLNRWKLCRMFDDKSFYDFYFYDVNRAETLASCHEGQWLNGNYSLSTIETVATNCKKAEKVIIKPSRGSSGGKGIAFWQQGDGAIEDLLKQYKNCVVQGIIEQHADLSALHKESINSIRIMTMLLDGEVKILSSVLRIGVGKAKVDNISSGGVACGIDGNGCLKEKTFNAKGNSWIGHPDGLDLKGRKVPAFKECCEICKRLAPRFTRFSNLISWDFTVDKSGKPVLIEANLCGGELDFHQMCNGPIFGDETTTKSMIARFYKKKRLIRRWIELLH